MSATGDASSESLRPEDIGTEVAHDIMLGGEKKLKIVSLTFSTFHEFRAMGGGKKPMACADDRQEGMVNSIG
jgi:hypothetical protein